MQGAHDGAVLDGPLVEAETQYELERFADEATLASRGYGFWITLTWYFRGRRVRGQPRHPRGCCFGGVMIKFFLSVLKGETVPTPGSGLVSVAVTNEFGGNFTVSESRQDSTPRVLPGDDWVWSAAVLVVAASRANTREPSLLYSATSAIDELSRSLLCVQISEVSVRSHRREMRSLTLYTDPSGILVSVDRILSSILVLFLMSDVECQVFLPDNSSGTGGVLLLRSIDSAA